MSNNAEEALSNLSCTAGVDLVAIRRKYLAVKENSGTSINYSPSDSKINVENKEIEKMCEFFTVLHFFYF